VPGRTIFRESAVEAYRRRTEKAVLPRLVSGPVIACFWLLLGTLLAAMLVAWSVRVPTYVGASGVIVSRGEQHQQVGGTPAAVLFLPPDQSPHMRVGQPVHGQIGSSATYMDGVVAKVEPALIGPDAARKRYRIDGASDLVTEPSLVVTVRLGRPLSRSAYGGSRITARVEIGSERLLALFPVLGELAGGAS
jgi:hypothetical protein